MKTRLLLIVSILFATLAIAQTNSPPMDTNLPPEVTTLQTVENFLSQGTNFYVVPFGTITSGNNGKYSAGGGVALAYEISKNFVTALRLDYLNKAFYQGSLNAQFQVPIHLGSFELDPFVLAGAATPFGGGANNPGTIQGIVGTGLALRFASTGAWSHFLGLYDIEKWSATPGVQHRIGLAVQLGF